MGSKTVAPGPVEENLVRAPTRFVFTARRSHRGQRGPLRIIAAVGLAFVSACSGTRPIRELLDNAFSFDTRTVRIVGEVRESVDALGAGVYQVDDGTGSLAVWTKTGNSLPRVGAKINVEGEFRSAFPLGSQTVPVLMEQQRSAP
jgi:hypothetical protein